MATCYAWTWLCGPKWCFKMRCPKPNGFPAAWNFEQHLRHWSEWLRENDVPKPPNLRACTPYLISGSCVKDLTSHTESIRPTLCNHSPCAGTWVLFEFAPSVFFNLISPVYHPKPTIQNRHWLIWFFVCRCSTELLFFYNSFPALKGARISKDTFKDVFENGKKGNWSC